MHRGNSHFKRTRYHTTLRRSRCIQSLHRKRFSTSIHFNHSYSDEDFISLSLLTPFVRRQKQLHCILRVPAIKPEEFLLSFVMKQSFTYTFYQWKNRICVDGFSNRIFRIDSIESKLFWWFTSLFDIFQHNLMNLCIH